MREELKKLTDLLERGDKSIHQVMEASPVMLWFTENYKTTYFNKRWLDFTGRPLEKELGRGWLENMHPHDIDVYETTVFQRETPYEIQYRLKHRSGEYRWILEQGAPLFTADGTFKGFVGGCVDIHAQQMIASRLRNSEERYRRLFETARDGILILDAETGKITDVNPFVEKLFGYSKEELLGKKPWELDALENKAEGKAFFKSLQTTGYDKYEMPLKSKDGKYIDVELIVSAYTMGGVSVMQANIRDISERKKAEAADKAMLYMEQEKLKSSFIADATHELRTPLAIIKGNVELALRDKKTVQREAFEAINLEVNHLAALLADLTLLTTANRDLQKKEDREEINLSELIKEIVGRCKPIATPKNITISTQGDPSIFIEGNKMHMDKLFTNIISNAVFYGKENGFVKVNLAQAQGRASIVVSDDGIGIDKSDLPNIFERFYRAQNAREAHHEGTGLGLAISKWIVDSHEGSIEVASEKQVGTTFTITLPSTS